MSKVIAELAGSRDRLRLEEVGQLTIGHVFRSGCPEYPEDSETVSAVDNVQFDGHRIHVQ